jgi:hypothetical protein
LESKNSKTLLFSNNNNAKQVEAKDQASKAKGLGLKVYSCWSLAGSPFAHSINVISGFLERKTTAALPYLSQLHCYTVAGGG